MVTATHHHGDPVTAYPGDSCDGCVADFASDFMAKTRAQKPLFMVPAPADYLACDRTINEERERLRWEFHDLPTAALVASLKLRGGRTDDTYKTRSELVDLLVEQTCPRGWLDRRLREVL